MSPSLESFGSSFPTKNLGCESTLSIGDKHRIRDGKYERIEDRLGDALISVFSALNKQKLAREAWEEEARRRAEERKREEERRKRYNEEVQKTNALINQANDFDIACKIRAMVAAVEKEGSADEATQSWIAWAKAKADWYDPTVSAVDEFFGKRRHGESADRKALRERGLYGW